MINYYNKTFNNNLFFLLFQLMYLKLIEQKESLLNPAAEGDPAYPV